MALSEETKTQMDSDVKLAQSMADISSASEILDLVNRMIGYLDLILTEKARTQYLGAQLDGKKRVVEEFIRTGKERYKEIRELTNKY